MPKHKYIILLSGLFLALFFLPFSAKAEGENYAELLSASVTISGANVLCVDEDTTTLTANFSFATFDRLEWRTGATVAGTTPSIQVTATNNQIFSVYIFDASNNVLGTAQRQIFVVERPTVPTRVNAMLCEGEDTAVFVGMHSTTARHFVWNYDPISSPHMIGDTRHVWPNVGHSLYGGDSINVHIWYQNTPNRVVRTVFIVQMSMHSFTAGDQNRCYIVDSAMIEIDVAQFQLVANQLNVCVGETITLDITGNIDASSIVWSTGQIGGTSKTARITDIGDTVFSVEGMDLRGCQGVSSVSILGMPAPRNVRIVVDGGDQTICEGLSARLTVLCDDCQSFFWNTGHETESIDIWPTGRFTYTVTAFGGPGHTMCPSPASMEIIAINCEAIYFPTAIRLSSQIGNNVWQPILAPQEGTQYWFAIFNQWGQLIFESDDMSIGWNGKHNGQFVRPGTYVFLFRLTHIHRTWERTGTITVID